MTDLVSPASGTIRPLADVPDPVFAAEMVGPGLAIDPEASAQQALAPIAGRIVKLHPHAFALGGDDIAVLVHLGIDTVQLDGEGFDLLAAEGDLVEAGQPLVAWDPAAITAGGRSAYVMVCVLDQPAGSVRSDRAGQPVRAGEHLLTWQD